MHISGLSCCFKLKLNVGSSHQSETNLNHAGMFGNIIKHNDLVVIIKENKRPNMSLGLVSSLSDY